MRGARLLADPTGSQMIPQPLDDSGTATGAFWRLWPPRPALGTTNAPCESPRLLVEHIRNGPNLRPRVGQHPLRCNRFLNIGPQGSPRKNVAVPPEDSAESTGGRLGWPLGGSRRRRKRILSHRWALQAYSIQFRRTPRGRQPAVIDESARQPGVNSGPSAGIHCDRMTHAV